MIRSATLLVFSILLASCSGAETPTVTELAQQEFVSNPPGGALVLDVRTPAEYAASHVPGAMNIPHDELAARLSDLDSDLDRPIVVYCKSGRRAEMAATVLVGAGYTGIHHLVGDMDGWLANDRPTE